MADMGMKGELDPQAIEARTQAIGRALIADARRAHEHFSVLNRWTQQVLSWCFSDQKVKGSVLRFIDVLPSLTNSREIARHVHEYFPISTLRLPMALRIGTTLARSGLMSAPALAAIIRQATERLARQFIAESHPERVRDVIRRLAGRGATCSLDILGEAILSESEAKAYAEQCEMLIDEMAAAYASVPSEAFLVAGNARANLSVKPSALTAHFDPLSPYESVKRAAQRLQPILARAARHEALVNLDMEQYELRDLTLALARYVMEHSEEVKTPRVGIVVQAYLRDAGKALDGVLEWLGIIRRSLTIRLVKGAYWDYEVALALQRNWPVPVHLLKAESDCAFERLTERLLRAFPTIRTAIASHNVRSIAHAMALAEALGMKKHDVEFQLLYGMSDAIHEAIVAQGFPVRIYTPIGELIPGMAYLVRRLLENTSNESFLRRDFLDEAEAEQLLDVPNLSAAHKITARAHPEAIIWKGQAVSDFSKPEVRDAMARSLASVKSAFGRNYPLQLADGSVKTQSSWTVRNPALRKEIVGIVSHASLDDARRAAQYARGAQARWARGAIGERLAILRRAASLMRERRGTLAAWQVYEVAKTWREADADVVEAIDFLEYYADQMERLSKGRPIAQVPGERNTYLYIPRGPAAVISPWNFPLAISAGMIGAALAGGNAVIFKPAEQSSIVAYHLAQIMYEAGLPHDVLQYLPGKGEVVGAALVAHPDITLLLFTGSRAVGLRMIERAAYTMPGERHVKHVITEMGGKNAIIVDSDADLDAAIAGTLTSAFGYGGQKCSAASRVILHEAIAEQFLMRLANAVARLVVGDPSDPETDVGPLIDEDAHRRLNDAIDEASAVGKIVYRYPDSRLPSGGCFVAPTVVADIPLDHRLAKEEFFGPLVCVFRVKTFAEALMLANDTDYALTGGLYSRSPGHIEEATQAFDVGNLYINRPITGAIVGRQPFGGHRLSGLGTKAGGPDYLLQVMIPKTICEDTRRHGMPLE